MLIRFYDKNGKKIKDVPLLFTKEIEQEYHSSKERNEQINKAICRYAEDFLGGNIDCYEIIAA